MERKFISCIKYNDLAGLILNAKKWIIYTATNIHLDVAIGLSEAAKN